MTYELTNIKELIAMLVQSLDDPKFVDWLYRTNNIMIMTEDITQNISQLLNLYKDYDEDDY